MPKHSMHCILDLLTVVVQWSFNVDLERGLISLNSRYTPNLICSGYSSISELEMSVCVSRNEPYASCFVSEIKVKKKKKW